MDDGFPIFMTGVAAGFIFGGLLIMAAWGDTEGEALERGFIILQGDKYRLEHVD